MRIREKGGEDVAALKASLEWSKKMLASRERMLYWKRDVLRKVRDTRRPSIKHKVNRAQHSRELLRLKAENNERLAEMEAQRHA